MQYYIQNIILYLFNKLLTAVLFKIQNSLN